MKYLTFKLNRKLITDLTTIPSHIVVRSQTTQTCTVEIDCSAITFKVVGNVLKAIFFIGITKITLDLLYCCEESLIASKKEFLNGLIDLISDSVFSVNE